MGYSYSSNNKVIDKLERREFLGKGTTDAIRVESTVETHSDVVENGAVVADDQRIHSSIEIALGGETGYLNIIAKDQGGYYLSNMDALDTMISVLTDLRDFIRKHS